MKIMNRMTRIGLIFLIAASATKLAGGYFNEHIADGAMGLFYGIAIGTMLLGIRRTRCA